MMKIGGKDTEGKRKREEGKDGAGLKNEDRRRKRGRRSRLMMILQRSSCSETQQEHKTTNKRNNIESKEKEKLCFCVVPALLSH